jgi:RNA polymerase sigma-70 factor (ECF subfamily)
MTAAKDHEDPDAELLVRMLRGDQAACAVLVDRHLPGLHRLARRMLGSDSEADDVTQDVFLRAWEQADKWRSGGARYSTWLYQVNLNLCRDRLRSRRPTADLSETLIDNGPIPEQHFSAGQRQESLAQALAELPERQREALALFHFEGMSQQQAAQVMGVSEDALESLLSRARRQLKQRLMPATPLTQATGP